MDAVILAIGTELTLGQTVDTNSAEIARRLYGIGVSVHWHAAYPDQMGILVPALRHAAGDLGPDGLLVVTGGLGPTLDDLTRDALAEAFGVTFRTEQRAWEAYRKRFARRYPDREIPANNERQFRVPEGAVILKNSVGVALGFVVPAAADRPAVVSLPGIPREALPMVDDELLPWLRERLAERNAPAVAMRRLMTFGYFESALDERLGDLVAPNADPEGGIQTHEGAIEVRFIAREATQEAAQAKVDAAATTARERLGLAVFGEDGATLEETLAGLLAQESLTVAVAESCTGGLVTHLLSRISGISAHLLEGAVTYSNEAKMARLGVPRELLERHGAVSPEVAAAMVEGICRTSGADLGIATTGIAGPSGGTPEKPVGTVWVGVHLRGQTFTRHIFQRGNRFTVQRRSALVALNAARLRLLDAPDDTPDLGTNPVA